MARETPELKGKAALALWSGWLLGPMSWAMHQSGTYAILPWSCRTGTAWPAHALTVIALSIAIAGAAISWSLLPRIPRGDPRQPDRGDRSRLITWIGLGLSLAAVAGILLEASATWYLGLCAEGPA